MDGDRLSRIEAKLDQLILSGNVSMFSGRSVYSTPPTTAQLQPHWEEKMKEGDDTEYDDDAQNGYTESFGQERSPPLACLLAMERENDQVLSLLVFDVNERTVRKIKDGLAYRGNCALAFLMGKKYFIFD